MATWRSGLTRSKMRAPYAASRRTCAERCGTGGSRIASGATHYNVKGTSMKLSTRNQLPGTVTSVTTGEAMAVVKIRLDGGDFHTKEEVLSLVSERYQWIDFRGPSRREISSGQCRYHQSQRRCRVRKWITRRYLEEETRQNSSRGKAD